MRVLVVLAASWLCFLPGGASAQVNPSIIGMAVQNSMSRGPITCLSKPRQNKLEEMESGVSGAMLQYLKLASADTPADVSGLFRRKGAVSVVGSPSREGMFAEEQLKAFSDPIAKTFLRDQNVLVPFDSARAMGTMPFVGPVMTARWTVRDEAGAEIGSYKTMFIRQGKEWKIGTMAIRIGGGVSDEVLPYCGEE